MDIILLDEDPALIEVLSFNFTSAGYSVVVARRAGDLWDLLQTSEPRMLILDPLVLSEDDRRAFRDWNSSARVPVLLLSVDTRAGVAAFSVEVRSIGLLRKPFDLRMLLDLVADALTDR